MNKLEQLEATIAEGSCKEQLATIKTSELIGPALDWLVAKCVGDFALYHDIEDGQRFLNLWTDSAFLHYSSNWANGGPIIERENITVRPVFHPERTENGSDIYRQDGWAAHIEPKAFWITPRPYSGPAPLIAVCRCYVASKMGDVVEAPSELLE